MISYRIAAGADGPLIREMFYHAIYVPPGQPALAREIVDASELRKYHSGWPRSGDIGHLAFSGDRNVGAAWVRLLTGKEKGYGYVDEETPELTIAVLPEFQNQGIGTRLLELLEKESAKIYNRICLSMTRGNPAERLYSRIGFVRVEERGNDFVMIKRIVG